MNIIKNKSLQSLNTLGFKQLAQYYTELEGPEDALEALAFCRENNLPITVIGDGSNLVVAGDIPGLTVRMVGTSIIDNRQLTERAANNKSDVDDSVDKTNSGLDNVPERDVFIRADAGLNWHSFVMETLDRQAFGLENLALIPGTVGAAPVQNIGAYGVELSAHLEEVHCVDMHAGKVRILSRDECNFAYRDSLFKRSCAGNGAEPAQSSNDLLVRGNNTPLYLITSVAFRLSTSFQPNLSYQALQTAVDQHGNELLTAKKLAQIVCNIRQSKLPDPAVIGNAGSFFKNPTLTAAAGKQFIKTWPKAPAFEQSDGSLKVAAGWLIEQTGWRGQNHKSGRVGIYDKQALVLVNHGDGQADELLELADTVRKDVQETFGLELEQEPRTIP